MHHNYVVISGRHTSRDCVWPILMVAVLYTKASQTVAPIWGREV